MNKENYEEIVVESGDIFHQISIEEINIKSASKDSIPVLIEISLKQNSQTFHHISKPFKINKLTCTLSLIGFEHKLSLETYLNINNSSPEDKIYSVLLDLTLNSVSYRSIHLLNPSYKLSYLLQESFQKFPLDLVLRGKYETVHSILIQQILNKEFINIEDAGGTLNSSKLELIIQSSKLNVADEDEVLEIIGK